MEISAAVEDTLKKPSADHNFFEEEKDNIAAPPRGISESNEVQGSKRRRRPPSQHPTVVLPDFEDELKDDVRRTQSVERISLPNGNVPSEHRIRRSDRGKEERPKQQTNLEPVMSERHLRREEKPRRIGSQILDLRGGFAVNLGAIEDDIVTLSNDDLRAAIRHTTQKNKDLGEAHAQLSSRLYVEDSENQKFYTLSKRPKEWDAGTIDDLTTDTVDKSANNSTTAWFSDVNIYRTIRHFFLFSHGLLAGLSLLHCILLFTLTPPHQPDWFFFVRSYVQIAVVFRTLYHVLITLCAVSCLCRLDILAGFDRYLVTQHLDAVIGSVLYFVAAALTHVCDSTVTRLMLEWYATPDVLSMEVQEELSRLRIMDAVRTACVCAAWLLTAFRWKYDRFKQYLRVKSA